MTIQAKIYDKANVGNPDSPLSGDVQLLASQLYPLLSMDGGQPTVVERVKNMLNAAHAGKVTQMSTFGPQYEILWNGGPGDWCLKCNFGAIFEVKIGTTTAVVEISEATHY